MGQSLRSLEQSLAKTQQGGDKFKQGNRSRLDRYRGRLVCTCAHSTARADRRHSRTPRRPTHQLSAHAGRPSFGPHTIGTTIARNLAIGSGAGSPPSTHPKPDNCPTGCTVQQHGCYPVAQPATECIISGVCGCLSLCSGIFRARYRPLPGRILC